MAMTAAQRRKADRDRKRAQRAAAAKIGQPARVESVNAAIIEAISFAVLTADKRTWSRNARWMPVNIAVVMAAATDILVIGGGHDRTAAEKAIVNRLRPRGRHKMRTSVPSANPDPGLPTYSTRPPDEALRPH